MKRKTKAVQTAASRDIKTARRREKERLSERAVLITALAILYAVLLLFLQNMGRNSYTAQGAWTFEHILFWGSMIGAIFCAVWGAYKERRSMMLYSGIFLFVLWTMAIIIYGGNNNHTFPLVYGAILIAVVMTHVGTRLRMPENGKKGWTAFLIVGAVLFVLISVFAVALRLGYVGVILNMIR